MLLSQLTLDQILKIVQIVFYSIGTIVAILTYLSAKRGLLNTVNTEYQKRVMDRIKELSDELSSEFNPDSPNFWPRETPVIEVVQEINTNFTKNRRKILKTGEWPYGRLVSKDYLRLHRIIQNVKTDPFLPRTVRDTVIDFLEKRMNTLQEVYASVFDDYINGLIKGKYTGDLNSNVNWVHNKIVDQLYNSGYGISQVEDEVDKIRLAMQNYFVSFDPLPKRHKRKNK